MAIICQQVATISGSNSVVCGSLIQIYSMNPMFDTIDVLIDGRVSPGVSTAGNSFVVGSRNYQIILVSKNVSLGTAVVQLTISDVYVPPPPVEVPTHYLDLIVNPYSWYTPGGVADHLVSKIMDINGALANVFSGITDYQYLSTDILSNTPSGKVTVRINLKQLSVVGMAGPLLAAVIQVVIVLGAIILLLGFISGWTFTLAGAIAQITGKKYSAAEVVDIIGNNIIPKQLDECNKNYSDPNTAVGCQKSVICGATNGMADAFKTGVDCTTLAINSKIDACLTQYNIDGDKAKYATCVNGIAKAAVDETKAKVPQTTDWTTIALLGIGAFALVSMSKGSQGEK
jgi:hypothetical protein